MNHTLNVFVSTDLLKESREIVWCNYIYIRSDLTRCCESPGREIYFEFEIVSLLTSSEIQVLERSKDCFSLPLCFSLSMLSGG